MNYLTDAILLGLDQSQLIDEPLLNCRIHYRIKEPLLRLCDMANQQGFTIKIASSYRSFDRQLIIWNEKALGVRPLLDSNGQPLVAASLTELEKMFAILRWSALPGASRHHWGTDVDVYDGAAIDENYQLQLTVAETQMGGPFAKFYQWLDSFLDTSDCEFYRPYHIDRGGIAPEPWHLSFAPLANEYEQRMTEQLLRQKIEQTDIELKETILENLSEIFLRYVRGN
jgi:LAS superfamily LD-carboxypeptidase LdcB